MATRRFDYVNHDIMFRDETTPANTLQLDFSNVSGTQTLTVPAGNETIVAENTAQTLTNKSLEDATTFIVDDGDATKKLTFSLGGATTAKTLTLTSSHADDRTITLPDATDTLVGKATSDTLTNKTLTAPVIATIVNSGTLTLPTSTDTLVGKATTDTLTNKTLTAPVIATIVNSGTLTLPTSTDTLVGKATTDTLTNKTLTAPVIATIVNTGTLTLPTATDTLVARDVTETLTNKTLTTATLGSNMAAGGFKITGLGTPTAAGDAVTKSYVDAGSQGLSAKDAVRAKTDAALPAYTKAGTGVGATLTANANGAIPTVDGVTLVLNDRILVDTNGSTSDVHNGIYEVTVVGDGSNPWELTRTTDADEDAEVLAGMYVFVTEGTKAADSGFVLTTNNPITIDTTALNFTQFSGAGQIIAGDGLSKNINTLDVDLKTNGGLVIESNQIAIDLGASSITGTLAVADGGTGSSAALTNDRFIISNGSGAIVSSSKVIPGGVVVGTTDTQTLSGKTLGDTGDVTKALTFSLGGATTAKTMTIASSHTDDRTLTLPNVTDTLVARTTTDTLTNKTLTAPVIATIVNSGTLTLPTSTDVLVGRATTDTLTNKTLTLPVIASISNSGTVTLPTGTVTLVARTTTDTLTNKTLTAPVIATIVNSGTLTLPTSTDVLVGRATTDTLTNKTLTSPKIGTQILDTNGNELIILTATGSAVNELTLSNGAIGTGPTLTASGGDADINLNLVAKGTGKVRLSGLKYPNADGAANTVLATDGSGTLSFAIAETYLYGTSTTTDATQETMDVNGTIATATDKCYLIKVYTVARQTNGTNAGGWVTHGMFKNVSGTLSQVGSTDKLAIRDTGTGWDSDFAVSGTNILLKVQGKGSHNVNWEARYTVTHMCS